ncbi:MAG: RNA polymerase sigma factor [Krumholzibacteria bacterium]|nr:RNA polymerase sigma factor [Candidatus Krumholzibacteria bacterium]
MAEPSRSPGRPEPPPLPADVLAGVRAGRPEALAAFFEATFAEVYGLAFRMLGDPDLAEDATQEVFLRVQKAAPTLDPARDPRPWLRTVTANLVRDHWRSFGARVVRRSVPVDEDPDVALPLPGHGPAPDAGLLAAERDALVQDAIAKLPPDLREVVVLRDYQGLDHGTIAQMVGANDAAVRKRYSRALARLGELLRDVWP